MSVRVPACAHTCTWVWVQEPSHTPEPGGHCSLLPQGIVQAYQSGDIVLGNTTSMGRWELMGSFFFSVSTITTIGKSKMGPGGRGWGGGPPPQGQGSVPFAGVTRLPGYPQDSKSRWSLQCCTTWEQNLRLPADLPYQVLHFTSVLRSFWARSG